MKNDTTKNNDDVVDSSIYQSQLLIKMEEADIDIIKIDRSEKIYIKKLVLNKYQPKYI